LGSEPELYETSCGAPFVWTLMDGNVLQMLREVGVPSGSIVAVCPHEVQHISYTKEPPGVVQMAYKRGVNQAIYEPENLITDGFILTKRKFRHE